MSNFTFTKQELLDELNKLSPMSETISFSDIIGIFSKRRDEIDLAFVKEARRQVSCEGLVEVDDNAMTSRDDDESGSYVAAWVWIATSDSDELYNLIYKDTTEEP